METSASIPVAQRIVGLRLHTATTRHGVPASPRGKQLFDLQEREARRAVAEQAMTQLLRSARGTVEAIPQQVGQRLDEVATIAVELGLAIAHELVGAAQQKGLIDPLPTVVRCLRDCVHGSSRADLVVRLHPDDLAGVQTALASRDDLAEEVAAARFVADATVARGGVRAETGAGRLQWDPQDVLARLCSEVRREANS